MLLEAAAYPFRRQNGSFLGIATGLGSIPPLVAWLLPGLPYVGTLSTLVEGLVLCYLLLYFQQVLWASTRGDLDLPLWPEESDVQGLAERVFRILIPVILAFLPLIALVVVSVFRTGEWALKGGWLWGAIGLFAAGSLYLPIALLVYSFYGEWAMLNVGGGVRSIARIGGSYFLVAGSLVGLLSAYLALVPQIAKLPFLLAVPIQAFVFCYAMLVSMRLVGGLYARHQDRLGWDS
jgi:hypothetical protein